MTAPDPGPAPEPADGPDGAVSRANAAFYEALERGEPEAMAEVWAHDDDVTCAHPGRSPLRGWDAVRRSWETIFAADGNPQIILTDEVVNRRGPVAWVTVTENMLARGQTATATAVNIFAERDGRWLLVAHHAGPILS